MQLRLTTPTAMPSCFSALPAGQRLALGGAGESLIAGAMAWGDGHSGKKTTRQGGAAWTPPEHLGPAVKDHLLLSAWPCAQALSIA